MSMGKRFILSVALAGLACGITRLTVPSTLRGVQGATRALGGGPSLAEKATA